jgi:hypothetical protein
VPLVSNRFVSALERRPPPSDPASRRAVDSELALLAEELAKEVRPPATEALAKPLPRRVATAFALALASGPHFAATLANPERDGTVDPGDPPHRSPKLPLVVSNETIERALGLSAWEIDELREEIDRRVGRALKQIRALHWLWTSFSLPDGAPTLARVLHTAASGEPVDLVRRGGQLALLVELPPPPVAAMFLPWLAGDAGAAMPAFDATSVDRALRARIGRGIGAGDAEMIELLDGMVSLLPRRGAAPYLAIDQWRSYGYAAITDLGVAYAAGHDLLRPLHADSADWRDWIVRAEDGHLVLGEPAEQVFDDLAIGRVQDMVRLVYAAILATASSASDAENESVTAAHVDLYDAPRHVAAVLQPLVTWAGRTATHKWIAGELGRPYQEVAALLEEVRNKWIAHMSARWTAGAEGQKRPSVQTLLARHLVGVHASIRRLLRLRPDPRASHRDLVLLFAGHYLREARVERLWIRALSDDTEPATVDDVTAPWFWPAWLRTLDTRQIETP